MAIAPGTVPVYFIMLYVLGSGVDKKVTNPPPSRLARRRRAMHNRFVPSPGTVESKVVIKNIQILRL